MLRRRPARRILSICIAGGNVASKTEEHISRLLHEILANLPNGASVADSVQFRDVLSGLEYFLPAVIKDRHPEWKYESLDGILPLVARKTGQGEVEIFGECILISDQTLTPLHLRLQVSETGDEVSWLELRLGQLGEHGMVREPYQSPTTAAKRVYSLSDGKADTIEWVYKVTFGVRRL